MLDTTVTIINKANNSISSVAGGEKDPKNEKSQKSRGKYNSVREVDCDRLVEAYKRSFDDYKKACVILNIKRTTANTIIQKFNKGENYHPKPKGGSKPRWSKEMNDWLDDYVTYNAVTTIPALRQRLIEKFPLNLFCESTVADKLENLKFTYKKLHYTAEASNTAKNKAHRRDYVQWKMVNTIPETIFYVDEAGCNLRTLPTHGWSKKGLQPLLNV